MDLKVPGSYVLSITEKGSGDQIFTPDEVQRLVLIEKAGLGLPELRLEIATPDRKKFGKLLTPGFTISFNIGLDQLEQSTAADYVKIRNQVKPMQQGENRYFVTMYFLLDALSYIYEQRMETYESENSPKPFSDVWNTVTERNNLEPMAEATNDQMNWVQPNITDRQFLERSIWHSYYRDGQPSLSCINRSGEAVLTNPEAILGGPTFQVVNVLDATVNTIQKPADVLEEVGGDKNIAQTNYYELTQSEGFFGAMMGDKKKLIASNQEEGTDDTENIEAQPIIQPDTGFPFAGSGGTDLPEKTDEREFINRNVHAGYWKAYLNNQIHRASISNVKSLYTFLSYVDRKPLELVEVQLKSAQDLNASNGLIDVEQMNGQWIVSESRISIIDNKFSQTLICGRESINNVGSSLFGGGTGASRFPGAIGTFFGSSGGGTTPGVSIPGGGGSGG